MHIDKNRIIEIAKELIKYKSFTGMEKGVGEYISGFFDKIGVEYRVFEKEKGSFRRIFMGNRPIFTGIKGEQTLRERSF
jgi:putative aminopeptidase FrvX